MPSVLHATEYGAETDSLPSVAPSTRNWTPATPTLSDALAETVTALPDTTAPFAGPVMAPLGGVVSGMTTVTVTEAVDVLPAGSRARTDTVCAPAEDADEFQVTR